MKSPDEATGKLVEVNNNALFSGGDWKRAEIIGVIEDYEQSSFLETGNGNVGIMLTYKNVLLSNQVPKKIALRIDHSLFPETLESIESLFRKTFNEDRFLWYFLDDHFNSEYNLEKIARNQVTLFTGLAIGIACLGLLGLLSNKVVVKTKEIGIRKVLGAKLYQIGHLLLHATFRQIITAAAVAIPIAYYLVHEYLEKFSERISLSWWHYLVPVGLLVLILLCSIVSVLWKAATSNPVEALKYE